MVGIKRINVKLPARASIWYLGASAVAKGVGFLITPFFTRMISGEAYGELTLYLSLVGIASVGCSAVNTGSAIYKEMKNFENERQSFLKSALLVSLSFSALICLVLFAFSPFFKLTPHLYIPLTLQIICDGIAAVALSSEKFSYRYKTVTLINLLSSVLPALITLALLKAVAGRIRIRIYALLTISVCIAIWSLIKILRSGSRANKKMAVSLIKSASPLIPHSISTALSGQADKLIIPYFLGAFALAKYSVIHSLGVALQFMVSAVGFALGPWMIRRLEGGEYKKISVLVAILLSVFSALSLCLIALAPEAMKILAPKEYLDAFPALLPIALTTPLVLFSSVVTVCLVHSNKGLSTVTVSLVGAVTNLILNFTLIPKLSYLGAGLAMFLSSLASTLTGLCLLLRARLGEVLSARKISKILIPTVALGTLLFLLFDLLALRVILLTVPAVMLLNAFYSLKGLIVE